MSKGRRWLYLFVGINLVALSVNLFLSSELGSNPLTVLQQGMHIALNITVGQASILYNVIVLAIAAIFAKKALGLGTVIYLILVGILIDGYALIFSNILPQAPSMTIRVPALVFGQILMSGGFAVLIHAGLGTHGLDAILVAFEKKVSYKVSRTITDILFVVLGAVMGGVIGIGTLFAMLTSGILVDAIRRIFIKRSD